MRKLGNKIIHDDRTYIESMGKQDKETVRDALADKGADTILRVCLGMTGQPMPTRVLSYFASALAVQEHYFPEAELQFVYPFRAAHLENGVDIVPATDQIKTVDTHSKRIFARRFRTDHPVGGQVKSFTDAETPDEDLKAAVGDVLAAEPELQQTFAGAASGRRGNYIGYVAAHVLMHDTNPVLQPFVPLTGGDFADTNRQRVISIGAQSERPFYLARMACQRAKILPTDRQVETGQLFTRHILPPYIACREGEPLLRDIYDTASTHRVASVERDHAYLQSQLQAEQQIGEFLPQSAMVDMADRPKATLGVMEVHYT